MSFLECQIKSWLLQLNRFILDVGVHKYGNSEKEEAKAFVLELRETIGDRPALLMFDRNYSSISWKNPA